MKNKTILWIEDELESLDVTVEILKGHDFEVRSLRTASEVVENCRKEEAPELVILDLFLPAGKSPRIPDKVSGPDLGLWVLGHLRQKLGWSSRVAVISGNLSENAERKLQEYGVEAIFDKILVEDEPVLDWALERHTEDDSEEEE